jgi:hypothetical protein
MRHFHRTSVGPDAVMQAADAFFARLDLAPVSRAARAVELRGPLGQLRLSVRMEGGHYTFVEVHTDQVGESRLDKNVKRFFVELHRQVDARHASRAHY